MLPNRERASVAFTADISEKEGEERAAIMNELSGMLGETRIAEIKRMMSLVATCAKKDLRTVRSETIAIARELVESDITIAQLAEMWTSGALAKKFPDHVKAKTSSDKDAGRFNMYILPLVGEIPVRMFRLDDALEVLEKLPETLAPGSRRQVAQIMSRLMSIAVFPMRKIAHSPIPKGFLPNGTRELAKQFLYVGEEAQLLRCEEVPLGYRMLYGFLARNGCRISEALALEWKDINLADKVLSLDKNKTDDPRSWALADDVVMALREWRKRHMHASQVFVHEGTSTAISEQHIAALFREHLKSAGVNRAELMVDDRKTEKPKDVVRIPVRVHDLRATFVTISLACGKTDVWVVDRTGHRSWTMVRAYRRSARMAAELKMGDFVSMHEGVGFASKPDSVPIVSLHDVREDGEVANSADKAVLRARIELATRGFSKQVSGTETAINPNKSTARVEQTANVQNPLFSSRDNSGTEQLATGIESDNQLAKVARKRDKDTKLVIAVNNTIDAAKSGKKLATLTALEDLAALTKWGKA